MATVNGYIVGSAVLNGSGDGALVALIGDISATATLSPSILSVAVQCAGAVACDLTVSAAQLNKDLAPSGDIAASGFADGGLTIDKDIRGSADAQASVSNLLLDVDVVLGGQVDALAQTQGSITRDPALSGGTFAEAQIANDIPLHSVIWPSGLNTGLVNDFVLNGVVGVENINLEGSSTASAELPAATLGTIIQVDGSTFASAELPSAPLSRDTNFFGSVQASLAVENSGQLDIIKTQNGDANAVASAESSATVAKPLTGVSDMGALTAALITQSVPLDGSLSAQLSVEANVSKNLNHFGDTSASAVVDDAAATVFKPLVGQSDMGALTAALITQLVPIGGELSATLVVTSVLTKDLNMQGVGMGSSLTVEPVVMRLEKAPNGLLVVEALVGPSVITKVVNPSGSLSVASSTSALMTLIKEPSGDVSCDFQTVAQMRLDKPLNGDASAQAELPQARLSRIVTEAFAAVVDEQILVSSVSVDIFEVGDIDVFSPTAFAEAEELVATLSQ